MLECKVKHEFSLGQSPARCDRHAVDCFAVPRRHRSGWSRNCHQAVHEVATQLQAVQSTWCSKAWLDDHRRRAVRLEPRRHVPVWIRMPCAMRSPSTT